MNDAQGSGVDLHHVEADVGVGITNLPQISLSGPGEKKSFFCIDGVPGKAIVRTGAGLDLCEDEHARPPLPGHDVDLVTAAAPVAFQYAATVAEEIPCGQPFPPSARVHGTK